jgi:hypothetical protein
VAERPHLFAVPKSNARAIEMLKGLQESDEATALVSGAVATLLRADLSSVVHTTSTELEEIGALVDERLIPMHDVGYAETLRAADALVRLWPEYLALRAAVFGDVTAPAAVPAPRPFLRPLGATPLDAGDAPAGV